MKHTRTNLSLAAALALAGSAPADTIFRTDGPPIENCKVQSADLKEVAYRPEGKDRSSTIASDKVVRIEHDQLPKLLDSAEAAVREDQLDAALGDLQEYLDSVFANDKAERRSFPWAPAYALHRLVTLRASAGDLAGTVAAAERLIEKVPDSFYVPMAYLAKAEAQSDLGEQAKARATLRDLLGLESKGLSKRWQLEAELALALAEHPAQDKGEKLRQELARISQAAQGQYPTVVSRAELAQAETLLEREDIGAAEKILQRAIGSGTADARTMAGALTGLGDCQFRRAAALFKDARKPEAEALLRDALLSYLRVVVMHVDQPRYVAKSMFFAGRTFDQFQDDESKERAQRMYREVIRRFPGSPWAKQARDFRR
jgi:tetratricopeptide (TPR) repeat protein